MESALTVFYTWALSLRQGAAWKAWLVLGAAAAVAAAGCLFGYRLRRFFAGLTGAVGLALCGFALFPFVQRFFSDFGLPFLRYVLAAVLGAAGLALGLRWPKPFIGVCGGASAFFLTLLFCAPLSGELALAIGAGAAAAGALASVFWTRYVFTALMTAGGALTFPFLLDALFEEKLQEIPYLLLGLVIGLAALGLLLQFLNAKEKKQRKTHKEPVVPEKLGKKEKMEAAAALFAQTSQGVPPQEKTIQPPLSQKEMPDKSETGRWDASFSPPFAPGAVFFEAGAEKTEEEKAPVTPKQEEAGENTTPPRSRWTCICGAENEASDAFCSLCATPCPPDWECPRCAEKNKAGSFFCGRCQAAYNLIKKQL